MGCPASKINDVMKESWDYLIVLDACRHDYFKREYEKFFQGELENRISLGSATPEWCRKQFKGYFPDIIYISGNPYINSKKAIAGFDAKKHFYKVIDVWDFGWNEELWTVTPEKITAVTLNSIDEFPKKRRIIHYLQPHVPYISPKFKINLKGAPVITGWRNNALNANLGESKVERYLKSLADRIVRGLKHSIHVLFMKIGLSRQYELRKLFGLPPARPMEATWRLYGVEGLREAYSENLKIVLEHVTVLCTEILRHKPSAQIVVTADHGDLLGENGNFDHYPGSKDLVLLEVPWLKVKSIKNSAITQLHTSFSKPVEGSYKTRLKEKIKRVKKAGKI
jgi:hypothetical protein